MYKTLGYATGGIDIMRIRWKNVFLTVGIGLWLGVFTVSCVPFWEKKGETVEKTSEKNEKEEPPLGTMEQMEQQAEQGELTPPVQEVEPLHGPHPHP
ncbi:MAG: hypothetical protein PVG49_14800 [Desulfobacteraceae bacterium]